MKEDLEMKYIVEVNAKYLVSIEAESLCNAEHKLLGYKGIWGAMAYDRAMMKTDTFAGAVQGCEMVSMNELITMINEAEDAKKIAEAKIAAAMEAAKKVEELQAAMEAAKKAALDADRAKADALYISERASDRLGKQRN